MIEKKNMQIQAVRGIFCIFIMIYHFTLRYSDIYGNNRFAFECGGLLGTVGLGGFLFISGIYMLNPNKFKDFHSFVLKKVKRLYPEYIYAIIIIFLVNNFGFLGKERSTNLYEFLFNIPMLNVFFGIKYVDGAHWYVIFLVLMAVFFGLIVKLKLYYYHILWLFNFIGIFLMAILNYQKSSIILLRFEDYIRYYLLVTLGAYFSYLKYEMKKINVISTQILLLSFLSMFLLDGFLNSLLILGTIIFIELALNRKIGFLSSLHVIVYIGNFSYMIYLMHQNIGFSILNFLEQYFAWNIVLELILTCCIIIFISIISEKILLWIKNSLCKIDYNKIFQKF